MRELSAVLCAGQHSRFPDEGFSRIGKQRTIRLLRCPSFARRGATRGRRRPTDSLVHDAMDSLPQQDLLDLSFGPSTLRLAPWAGGRLMSWHVDGDAVIYWPEHANWDEPGRVRGGNPLLFPFLARHRVDGELGRWRDGLRGFSDLTIAVNVSGRQLLSTTFVDLVGDALAEAGVPAGSLWLEITETALMTDVKAASVAPESPICQS